MSIYNTAINAAKIAVEMKSNGSGTSQVAEIVRAAQRLDRIERRSRFSWEPEAGHNGWEEVCYAISLHLMTENYTPSVDDIMRFIHEPLPNA